MKRKFLLVFTLLIIVLHDNIIEAQANNDITRLGVMKFSSRAEGVSDKQAEAIGDMFARMLANSKSIIVVERDRFEDLAKEYKFAQSGRFEDEEVIQEDGMLPGFEDEETISFLSWVMAYDFEISEVDKAIEDIINNYERDKLISMRNEVIQALEHTENLTKDEIASLEQSLNEIILKLARMK